MKATVRMTAIKFIIENSASFQVKNIGFRQLDEQFIIFDAKHNEFYSTGIVVDLSAFDSYFMYEKETQKTVLVVW